MNEVNDVTANREDLLDEIIADDEYFFALDLSDNKEDLYDFSNELLMRVMGERLVETLQTWTDSNGKYVRFGNKLFATMNEQQQRGFFRAIFALPFGSIEVGEVPYNNDETIETEKPVITMHTSALLDGLADLNSSVGQLRLKNFVLSNQSDVKALSKIILAKRETLESIYLEDIEFLVDNSKRDEDGPAGLLDPLFYAASRLKWLNSYELSARTPPCQSSLVSTNAVRALFGEERGLSSLHLQGLASMTVIAMQSQKSG